MTVNSRQYSQCHIDNRLSHMTVNSRQSSQCHIDNRLSHMTVNSKQSSQCHIDNRLSHMTVNSRQSLQCHIDNRLSPMTVSSRQTLQCHIDNRLSLWQLTAGNPCKATWTVRYRILQLTLICIANSPDTIYLDNWIAKGIDILSFELFHDCPNCRHTERGCRGNSVNEGGVIMYRGSQSHVQWDEKWCKHIE